MEYGYSFNKDVLEDGRMILFLNGGSDFEGNQIKIKTKEDVEMLINALLELIEEEGE